MFKYNNYIILYIIILLFYILLYYIILLHFIILYYIILNCNYTILYYIYILCIYIYPLFIGQIPKFSCFKALPDASDAHLHPHAGVPLARHSASAWDTSGAQGRGECGGSGAPCATLSRSEEERRGDFKWGLSVAS